MVSTVDLNTVVGLSEQEAIAISHIPNICTTIGNCCENIRSHRIYWQCLTFGSQRNPKEPLFGRKTLGLAVLQGLGILVIVLAIFVVALYRRQGELDARALTFTTLILANLFLILSESSSSRLSLKILKSPNNALWWVIGGGLVFLLLVLYVPFLRQLFSFSFLHPIDLAICLGGGAIALLWFEQLKFLNRPKRVIQSKSRKPIPENL